jgi:hypothetical protein
MFLMKSNGVMFDQIYKINYQLLQRQIDTV